MGIAFLAPKKSQQMQQLPGKMKISSLRFGASRDNPEGQNPVRKQKSSALKRNLKKN